MSFSSISENENYPLQTFLFELLVFMCCLAPLTDLYTKTLDYAGMPRMNMLVNTVFYLLGINQAYVIMLYEFSLINDEKPIIKKIKRAALIIVVIDNLVTLLNIRYGYFFTISELGTYCSSSSFWVAYIAPFLIVAATAFIAAKEMKPGKPQRSFLFFWIFAVLFSMLQIWQETLTLQYTGYTFSLLVIYMNIQSELDSLYLHCSDKENTIHEISNIC